MYDKALVLMVLSIGLFLFHAGTSYQTDSAKQFRIRYIVALFISGASIGFYLLYRIPAGAVFCIFSFFPTATYIAYRWSKTMPNWVRQVVGEDLAGVTMRGVVALIVFLVCSVSFILNQEIAFWQVTSALSFAALGFLFGFSRDWRPKDQEF